MSAGFTRAFVPDWWLATMMRRGNSFEDGDEKPETEVGGVG
jgi:hypothetical protein